MTTRRLKQLIEFTIIPCILYLPAIMPRMMNRPDMSFFKKKYFAHRGLYDNESDAPENSMAAFRKAVENGYGMELDVHVTKDDIPVVFHDFELERMCGADGEIEDYTYEELQRFTLGKSKERIPKLEDLLLMVQGCVPLIVEIKSETADVSSCAVIDRMLRTYDGGYCIESFNPMVLWWFRRHHNEVVRGQLATNFRKDGRHKGLLYFFMTHLTFNFLTKPDFIAYNHNFRKEPGRRICRKLFKNTAVAWTIRSFEELEKVREEYDAFIFESFNP